MLQPDTSIVYAYISMYLFTLYMQTSAGVGILQLGFEPLMSLLTDGRSCIRQAIQKTMPPHGVGP